MKNYFVFACTAIALAVPLGIGGVTITAPATATDAEAQSFLPPGSSISFLPPPPSGIDVLEVLRQYQTGRCTVYQLWDCDDSVVSHVAGEFRSLFDYFDFDHSIAFPNGSDGANHITFDTLVAESRAGAGTQERRDLIERYLLAVFPDSDVDPAFRHAHQGTGYIHPDTRADWRREHGARWDVVSSRDETRIARYFCEEAKGHFWESLAQGQLTNLCEFLDGRGAVTDKGVFDRYFESTRFTNNNVYGWLREELHDQYQIGVPLDDVARQITAVRPLDSLASIEDIVDHRMVTSENRGEIIELQNEVAAHEETLSGLEPAVARNTQVVEALGSSVGVLSQAVAGIAEDTEKNTAGIALAYALDAPGLSYGKRFAITGALGQFRGESAVGFSGTFKVGEFILISVGGGFAGSGDSSVTGGKLSATYEWQ